MASISEPRKDTKSIGNLRRTIVDMFKPKKAQTTKDERRQNSVVQQRGHWNSKTEFLLSCIGMSVGLGNLWRFPYLAYKYSGAAFIIPYVVFQILLGNPVYFMEIALGQYSGLGPTLAFRCNPLAKGIGISMMVVSGTFSVYYASVMALCVYYFCASLQSELPWTQCQPEWIPSNCWTSEGKLGFTMPTCERHHINDASNVSVENYTTQCKCSGDKKSDFNLMECPEVDHRLSYGRLKNITIQETKRRTLNCTLLGCTNNTKPPEHFYFYDGVLKRTDSTLNSIGAPLWDMTLCLLLVWIITILACIKGIRVTGKLVYLTAIFPYAMILVLLIKEATLDGSAHGLQYFLVPQWHRLLDAQMWLDAGGQVIYSLSISSGPIIAFGSYNRIHNDCFIDSIVVCCVDVATSLLAGIVVFMTLGVTSFTHGVVISEVAEPTYGLAFVTYSQALAHLPVPQLWSFLFFIMMCTLSIDSEFNYVDCIITGITDSFPKLLERRIFVAIGVGVVMFLLGLPLVCPGGLYLLTLLDTYGFVYALYFIALFELIAVIWMYDALRLLKDMHYMLGYQPRPAFYWMGCWTLVSPIILFTVSIVGLAHSDTLQYTMGMGTREHMEPYEAGGQALGPLLLVAALLPIPITAVWVVFHTPGETIPQRIVNSMTPDDTWQAQDAGTTEDHVTYIKT